MMPPTPQGVAIYVLLAASVMSGCAVPPGMEGGRATATDSFGTLPPPGHGTLRQDEISLPLTSGALRILVTPLEESATRVTAPDTYRRLSGLSNAHRNAPGMGESATLFLVSFFSEQPDQRFVPEEVQLVSRGIRFRPTSIIAVTPSWGERRLRQRVTEMAVYAFSSNVDLESDLTLAYGLDQTAAWSAILRRIQAERARARARAGGQGND
jgi:hypothetical protein